MKQLRIRDAVLMLVVCATVAGCAHPKGELVMQIAVEVKPAAKQINPMKIAIVSDEANVNIVGGKHETFSKLIASSLSFKLDSIRGVSVVSLTSRARRIAGESHGLDESKLAQKLGAVMDIDAVALGSLQSLLGESDYRGPIQTNLVYQLRLIDAASGVLLVNAEASVEADGGYLPPELADETAQAIANELEAGIR